MPDLAHLLQDEPQAPVYQLDFGDRVTDTVAQVVAQQTAERLVPFIQALLEQAQITGGEYKAGTESVNEAVRAARKALEQAVAAESASMQESVKKAAKAITAASSADVTGMRDALVDALGSVAIPDHSEQLARIEAAQSMVMQAIGDMPVPKDPPSKWHFDVNRNRNGFIQTVDAEAK